MYLLRVLHLNLHAALCQKGFQRQKALGLGFMGGRYLGEGWMVSSRWRQARNLSGTGL